VSVDHVFGIHGIPLFCTPGGRTGLAGRRSACRRDGIELARRYVEQCVRIRELTRHLEDDGWKGVRQPGDITQLRHALRPGVITIAGDQTLEVPARTLRSAFPPATPAARERTS
jgi:predicted RNA binding protein YcfA (HicA-like mRNA interferase family)